MRKKKVFAYILYFGSILFFLSVQSSFLQKVPSLIQLRLNQEEGTGITIEKLLQIIPDETCIFSSEENVVLEQNGKRVRRVMASEGYLENVPVSLVSGSLLSDEMIHQGNPVAMISKELALELYLTVNAVGQKFSMEETEYTVIGVYENTTPEFVGDGRDRIYVPYKRVSGWQNQTADMIGIPENDEEHGNTLETLRVRMGIHFNEYEVQNMAVLKRAARQGTQLLNFLFGILIFAWFLKKIIYKEKQFFSHVQKGLKHQYPGEYIKTHKRQTAGALALLIGAFLFAWLLWKTVKYPIMIPTEYIPYENIFDVSHYAAVLLGKIQLYHRGVLAGNGEFGVLLAAANVINLIVWCVEISYLRCVYRNKKTRKVYLSSFMGVMGIAVVCLGFLSWIEVPRYIVTIILMIGIWLFKLIEVAIEKR